MFIRRRRLLWLIITVGSIWLVISTYFVRSSDNNQGNRHFGERKFPSRSKNSVWNNAVVSTGFIPNRDFYYDDDGAEEVINMPEGQKQGAGPVSSRASPARRGEIDIKDRDADDPYGKQEMENVRTTSHALRWRKEPTPKMKYSAPKSVQQSKEQLKPSRDYVSQPPGRNGTAVVVNADQLSGEALAAMEDGWNKYGHNEYVNRMISLHRTLPDVRDPECRQLSDGEKLPDASVIITFYNEAWRTLLRTVHSVIDRSPPQMLREIVLIDDGSTEVHLKQQLDDYLEMLPVVRIVRIRSRGGVVRARQQGAALAKADVLVFLDSHCECTTGWLQPLLSRVAENRTVVAVPVMDVIDDTTFEYKFFDAQSINIGGFDWSLQFTWIGISDREKQRRPSHISPVRTPTMSGGMYVISRSFFNDLGGYDTGMDMWGAENLEISFRVWMCGGSVEVLPCSHVGHLFRHRAILSLPSTANNTRKNYMRVAEVWLDEYKGLFYEKIGSKLTKSTYGDIADRQELRKQLHCRSFDWYLKNIYPELFVPTDALASGEIRSADRRYREKHGAAGCLDSIVGSNAYNRPVNIWPCHGQGGNQHWLLSAIGEIRRDDSCLDFSGIGSNSVVIYPCHGQRGNQEWQYHTDGSVRHRGAKLCMELSAHDSLVMSACNGSAQQLWEWKRTDSSAPSFSSRDKPMPTTRSAGRRPARKTAQEIAIQDY